MATHKVVLKLEEVVRKDDELGILWGYASVADLKDLQGDTVPAYLVPWAITQYGADVNRIYGTGHSMGGWGTAAGSYSDTITVTSSTSGITGSPKTIAVSVTAVAGPAVSTTTLPSGKVSLAYSQTLTAIGRQTPYTWSVVSGSLCAGLALNASTGAITGAPTTSGTCSFTARVSDSNLATGDKALSIVVVPLPHPIPRDVGTRRLIIR